MAFTKFTTGNIPAVFEIAGNGHLHLMKLAIDGSDVKARHFISTDTSGPSAHHSAFIHDIMISKLDRKNSCEDFFYAYKSAVADSIVITQSIFDGNKVDFLVMNEEKDDKGYYNAEKIRITRNGFKKHEGMIASIYRGGNDESTMGPAFEFSEISLTDCNNPGKPLFSFTGVQVTSLYNNKFNNCNPGGILVKYQDRVRARHRFEKNQLINSGKLEKNQFVISDLSSK
jgi:poly(beta-D-mannuronate) lyase